MNKKKVTPKNGTTLFEPPENTTLHSGPTVNRRQAKILNLLRQGPMSSLAFTYEHKLTRAAARIFELRQKGFNITTHIKLDVQYRGDLYPKAATYVLEHPEWSAPSQPDSNTTTS
ncbi:helix-turn-helix domain-containing protein [Aeromonas jandaei]|uniref:helix-turn-helix domain-containing protein n=1 Tax=Aeromonas jandaei TaxID=650 RepID=UPI003BA23EC3